MSMLNPGRFAAYVACHTNRNSGRPDHDFSAVRFASLQIEPEDDLPELRIMLECRIRLLILSYGWSCREYLYRRLE